MMELILWRHAEAEDMNPNGDMARVLTKKGRRQAEGMAAWLRPRLVGDWRILCSPAARTVQTATPLALEFALRPALAPGKSAEALLAEAGWPDGPNTVVVGHQPTLGEAIAVLLGGGPGEVSVRKGAIWWFGLRTRGGAQETILRAVLHPGMLDADAEGAE